MESGGELGLVGREDGPDVGRRAFVVKEGHHDVGRLLLLRVLNQGVPERLGQQQTKAGRCTQHAPRQKK